MFCIIFIGVFYWVLGLTYHSFVIVIPYLMNEFWGVPFWSRFHSVSFHFFNIIFPIPIMCSIALMNMVMIQVLFVFSLGGGNFFFFSFFNFKKKIENSLWLLTQKKRFAVDRIEAFSFQETNSSIYRKI